MPRLRLRRYGEAGGKRGKRRFGGRKQDISYFRVHSAGLVIDSARVVFADHNFGLQQNEGKSTRRHGFEGLLSAFR